MNAMHQYDRLPRSPLSRGFVLRGLSDAGPPARAQVDCSRCAGIRTLTDSGRLRLRFVTTAAVAEYIGWSIQQVCCRLWSHPTLRCRSLAYREFVAGPYVVWSLAFLKLPTGS